MPMQNEKLNPVHLLLKISPVYQGIQSLLLKKETCNFIYLEFPQIKQADRVLDLGCGPAKLRHWIKADRYVGVDFNQSHINMAKKNYPNDTFIHGNIVTYPFGEEKFDKILMMGVLHHINDEDAMSVLSACKKILSPSGSIIAMDPLIEKGQNPIARLLARLDQGNYVRTREQYSKLVEPLFNRVEVTVRTDLLRVPYSHHLMRIQH